MISARGMAMDCSDIEGSSSKGRGTSLVSAGLRAALAGGAAVGLVLSALGAAEAAMQSRPQHAKREHAKKEPPPKPLDMPLIVVSIAKQQLTLYEHGAPVAHSPVSTGMAGHPTPTGIFSVIGKEIFHRSNIYSGAPMPYMQRITWSGVAMHAGVLPGYPASHGCIRMPHDFAVRLFSLTRMGARVLVVPHDVTPQPFESASLFTGPKLASIGEATPPPHGVRMAENQTPAVTSDAVDAAAHAVATAAAPKPAEAAPAPAAASAPPLADSLKSAASTAVSEAIEQSKSEQPAFTTAGAPSEATSGTVVVKPVTVTSPQPIEVRKTFEPVSTPSAGTQTFQPVPLPPAAQPAPPAPAAQPAQAAPAAPPAQTALPAPAPEVKPAPATAAADEFFGPERPLRPGPITVFVSKKENRVFVRKGFRPVFSWPVKFTQPEQPLGTHLFTAVDANSDGVSYRWQVVSLPVDTSRKAEKHVARDKKGRRIETVVQPGPAPVPATAAQALERIDIPPIALSRISALMSKGASLIISDKGLGSETGTETDFIVLTR